MAEFGAFAFGVVIGWFTYFTNRYRTGAVQFSDITTLVGVIGGGAVTALFGDGRSALFGAYGLGLAAGFFAYFAILVFMVSRSGGVFTWTWFLDGRRKALRDDETVDGSRGAGTAMSIQPVSAAAADTGADSDPAALRQQAIELAFVALRALAYRIAGSRDEGERARLLQNQARLTMQQNELLAIDASRAPQAEPLRAAVADLRALTAELAAVTSELDSTPDPVSASSRVLDRVEAIVAILHRASPT